MAWPLGIWALALVAWAQEQQCPNGTMDLTCETDSGLTLRDCDPLYCNNDAECSIGTKCKDHEFRVRAVPLCTDFPAGHQSVEECLEEAETCVTLRVCEQSGCSHVPAGLASTQNASWLICGAALLARRRITPGARPG